MPRRRGPADTVEGLARRLRGAALRLGLRRPVLVGHSWGGAAALAYALEFAEDVPGLVLLGAVASPDDSGFAEGAVSGPPARAYLGRASHHRWWEPSRAAEISTDLPRFIVNIRRAEPISYGKLHWSRWLGSGWSATCFKPSRIRRIAQVWPHAKPRNYSTWRRLSAMNGKEVGKVPGRTLGVAITPLRGEEN